MLPSLRNFSNEALAEAILHVHVLVREGRCHDEKRILTDKMPYDPARLVCLVFLHRFYDSCGAGEEPPHAFLVLRGLSRLRQQLVERTDIVGIEYLKLFEMPLGLLEIRIGERVLEYRVLVVGRKSLRNVLVRVDKVEDIGPLLVGRAYAVQARERLYGGKPVQLLRHIHCGKKGLVEASLVLVGDDEKTIVVLVKEVWQLVLRQSAVHERLGVPLAIHYDVAGERDKRLDAPELIHVLIAQLFVGEAIPDGRLAAGCDDHCLSLAVEVTLNLLGKVVDHDAEVPIDGTVVGVDEVRELPLRCSGLELRIVRHGLHHLAERIVGGVVGGHIEDEPFLYSLTHGVEVKCLFLPLLVECSEHVERAAGRCRRKAYDGNVALSTRASNVLGDYLRDLVDG